MYQDPDLVVISIMLYQRLKDITLPTFKQPPLLLVPEIQYLPHRQEASYRTRHYSLAQIG